VSYCRHIRNKGYRDQVVVDKEVVAEFPEFFAPACGADDDAFKEGEWEDLFRSGGRDSRRVRLRQAGRRQARKAA